MFVYDSLVHNLPVSISNFFSLSRDAHSYFTRNTELGKLVPPIFKSIKYGKNSIKYQCITEWNRSLTNMNNAFLAKYGKINCYKSFLDLNRKQFYKLIRKIICA